MAHWFKFLPKQNLKIKDKDEATTDEQETTKTDIEKEDKSNKVRLYAVNGFTQYPCTINPQ